MKGAQLFLILVMAAGRLDFAHHYCGGLDGTKESTVTGVVTQFKFVNPHATMYLDAKDPSGKLAKWVVEFDGRLNLSNFGWTANSLKTGEHVTVTGNPSRTEPNRIFFIKLRRADGTELLRGALQRLDGVEEERRQRALERDKQK
jgi:hypothetical protein